MNQIIAFVAPEGSTPLQVPVSLENPLPVYAVGGGGGGGIVPFPASSGASGEEGQLAYQDGYGALCVATNTWVFWATSGTYPF